MAFASGSRAGRARSRSAASPPTISVSWPGLGRRGGAAHRGVEQADAGGPRASAANAPERPGRDRAQVDEHGARRARRPAGRRRRRRPRATAVVVGEHREHDVGGRGERSAGLAATLAPSSSARASARLRGCGCTGPAAGRPAPARAPSPSPSGRCRRRRRSGRTRRRSPRRLHPASGRSSTIRSTPGTARSSRRRGRGQRDVRRRDPADRGVEAPEPLVGDDRDDLGAPAQQPRVLLDREQAARLGDRPEDRLRRPAARGCAGR